MNYFKYISIILVTIWVVFSKSSGEEALNVTDYPNYNTLYNQSRSKYFQIKAKIDKNNRDIEFYRARKLEAMSNGDFKSEKFLRLNALIKEKRVENNRLLFKKNSLHYKNFNSNINIKNYVDTTTESHIVNE